MGKYIDEDTWEEEEKISDEEMAYWDEQRLGEDDSYTLTEDMLRDFEHDIIPLEQLEGNYIEEYNRKVKSGGIEINEEYKKSAEKNGRLIKGCDPRSGIYGRKIAAFGFYTAGVLYWEKKDFQKATENFGKACEINPHLFLSWANKAKCHMGLAESLEGRERRWQYWYAVIDLWRATENNPAFLATRSEENRAVFERIEPKDRQQFETLMTEHTYYRGAAYSRKGDHNDAVDEFNQVIRRDPNNIEAYKGLLISYMFFEDYEDALPNAQKLLDANHDVLYAIQCRGIAYEEGDGKGGKKEIDKAIADFTTALSMDGNLSGMHVRRSYCYYQKGEYQKAVEDATNAITRGEAVGYSYRGLAYTGLGEYEKAVADIDAWLAVDPDDEWAAANRQKALDLLKAKRI